MAKQQLENSNDDDADSCFSAGDGAPPAARRLITDSRLSAAAVKSKDSLEWSVSDLQTGGEDPHDFVTADT